MNNNNNTLPTDETRFLQLKYSIKEDYFNEKLSVDEMFLFIWLQWQSNPVNGIFFTSYTSLEVELSYIFSKNHINKLMLSLKEKQYIWFPNHKGSRGNFQVKTKDYPLSNKHFLNIEKHFIDEEYDGIAEVEPSKQRLPQDIQQETKANTPTYDESPSRTPYTDTNTDIKTDTKKPTTKRKSKSINPEHYIPKTEEEQTCQEIAINLGEKNLTYLLSINKKHGLLLINEAWNEYKDIPGYKIDNPPAYFNKMIQRLIDEKSKEL